MELLPLPLLAMGWQARAPYLVASIAPLTLPLLQAPRVSDAYLVPFHPRRAREGKQSFMSACGGEVTRARGNDLTQLARWGSPPKSSELTLPHWRPSQRAKEFLSLEPIPSITHAFLEQTRVSLCLFSVAP